MQFISGQNLKIVVINVIISIVKFWIRKISIEYFFGNGIEHTAYIFKALLPKILPKPLIQMESIAS